MRNRFIARAALIRGQIADGPAVTQRDSLVRFAGSSSHPQWQGPQMSPRAPVSHWRASEGLTWNSNQEVHKWYPQPTALPPKV
jgi:hypothetical protein